MTKILIIGLGRIGYRHLESLVNSNIETNIDCIDNSEQILKNLKTKFRDKIRLFKDVESIDRKYDFLIHSTSSDIRLKSLNTILSRSKIRFAILEKLLVQNLQDLISLKKIGKQFEKCWVNTPMHEWDLYKKLKKNVNISKVSEIQFNYFEGLACNAIHFIDFISSWKKMIPIKLDTSKLEDWYESKRRGFYDVYGELKIVYSDNTILTLKSFNNKSDYHCTIKEEKKIWKLIEAKKHFYYNDNKVIEGHVEYQSELTGKLIEKILLSQKCDLPELDWSIDCHELLIESLLNYWNSYYKTNNNVLPIT